jgi:hypothetical protein
LSPIPVEYVAEGAVAPFPEKTTGFGLSGVAWL